MIAQLRGKFAFRTDDEIVIDVAGVGYLVSPTAKVLEHLPPPGNELTVLVYTDVKENSISLFGFGSQLERQVFLLLRKVSGIGPKTAIALVSGVGAEQLLKAIGSGEISELTKVSGVGRKTAERVLVELREQVGELLPHGSIPAATAKPRQVAAGPVGDTILALEKLGFSSDRAREAVNLALARVPAADDAGALLREALGQIG